MRRPLDQYMSESFAARALLEYCPVSGVVLEPCVGTGALVGPLSDAGCAVFTNDIDVRFGTMAGALGDATDPDFWKAAGEFDWIVTNPPYNEASAILKLAYEHARVGVAFLLRLSFTEPCGDRAQWLADHPMRQHLTLPRYSFTGNGKTDTLTCAWLVWAKTDAVPYRIVTVPRDGNS